MKFLVDAQLPPGLCGWFEVRGHSAEHVCAMASGAATDAEVAARAEKTGAVVVTKDEDFVTLRRPNRFALLWLRCGNASNKALAEWLGERWESVEGRFAAGETVIELH